MVVRTLPLVASLLLVGVAVLLLAGWHSRRRPGQPGLPPAQGGAPAAGVPGGGRVAVINSGLVAAMLLLPLFALSVLKLAAQDYSPFLYFQF